HTGCSRDWSSDVCSPDLATAAAPSPPTPSHPPTGRAAVTPASPATAPARAAAPGQQVSLTPRRLRQWMLVVVAGGLLFGVLGLRSEERRVGGEGGRGGPG